MTARKFFGILSLLIVIGFLELFLFFIWPQNRWENDLRKMVGKRETVALDRLGAPRKVIRNTDDLDEVFAGFVPRPTLPVENMG